MGYRSVVLALGLALGLAFLAGMSGVVRAADPLVIALGEQNNSGQVGMATLTDNGDGTTRVVVETTGAPTGPQPIHIHEGTCAGLNPAVKYPLTSLVNGRSETTVAVALATLLATPHAINAHKSPQEAAVYVACGDIVALPAPASAAAAPASPGTMPRTGGGAAARTPAGWFPAGVLLALIAGGVGVARHRRSR